MERYSEYWIGSAKAKGNIEPWTVFLGNVKTGGDSISAKVDAFTPRYLAYLRGVYREFRAKVSGVPGKMVRKLSLHV